MRELSKKIGRYLNPILGLAIFSFALWVLFRELRIYRLQDVLDNASKLSHYQVLLAIFITSLDYLLLTFYERLALVYIAHPLRYAKVAITSFVSYAFSNNVGFSIFSGVPVRYRLYSSWGFSILEIAKIVVYLSVMFFLGLFVLAGIIFTIQAPPLPDFVHLPVSSTRILGFIYLASVAIYLTIVFLRRKPIQIGDWEFSLPSFKLSLAQISMSCVDLSLACGVLYCLLPGHSEISYFHFLGIYLVGVLAGMMSQIPGGLGVFETVILLFLKPYFPAPAIFGSLLVFRAIYYLMPLGTAALLLGTYEVTRKQRLFGGMTQTFGEWVPRIVPSLLAWMTFAGGAVLLFSGALPADSARLAWLQGFIPLPVLEISHFSGSLMGAGLLLLALGLERRVDSAYRFAVCLLGGGIIFSLLKGFDYEEAVILSVMLAVLLPCRKSFYRKSSLLNRGPNYVWFVTIGVVILSSVWFGFFVHQNAQYSHDLWWRFAFFETAPRFLRAAVGVVAFILFFGIERLFRPLPSEHLSVSEADIEKARSIVERSRATYAHLACTGDKSFLFSWKGNAFIMYSVQGRSWVTQGDPVGPVEEWSELLWRFRELSDRYNGRTVFFEIAKDNLHLYLDLGLSFLKLGEEARVPLDSFSLEGSERAELRQVCHRAQKEELTFEVASERTVPSLLPELKQISDAWLLNKNTKEKGFALGYFDPEYLKHYPIALVRKRGKIVAFANLWLGAERAELSCDLIRYLAGEAPHGTMDYLLTQSMLWGKAERFRRFDLGLAALSGLERHPLASRWNRVGNLIYGRGEYFYNFQGIRHYKEKFGPIWEPVYLACAGGLVLPRVLADISLLISGGAKGLITK